VHARPVAFTALCSFKVYSLVVAKGTLRWGANPRRSLSLMWAELRAIPGCLARLSQLFIYGMEFRYRGGWAKEGSEASFWGFLMGAYTDSFWGIFTWVLVKKLFAALNKQLLGGAQNAIVNIVVYSCDFLIFAWALPFSDNMVNMSQVLAAARCSSSAAVLAESVTC
jgi:hypothetical protein